MTPFPEHAPSRLSASGMLLIMLHGADATPASAVAYLPRLCTVFIHSFNVYYVICYLINIVSPTMNAMGEVCERAEEGQKRGGRGAGERRESGVGQNSNEIALNVDFSTFADPDESGTDRCEMFNRTWKSLLERDLTA